MHRGLLPRLYDKLLFHGKTLRDLPDHRASRLQQQVCKPGPYGNFSRLRGGLARRALGRTRPSDCASCRRLGGISLPIFAAYIDVPAGAIAHQPGADLFREPYTRRLWLTDGGIYDNLGIEPVWKRYKTILVSDGGAVTPPSPRPRSPGCLRRYGRPNRPPARDQHAKARTFWVGTNGRTKHCLLGHR